MTERMFGQQEEERLLYGRSNQDWHDELAGEDLPTPGTRYGETSSEVAWWAVGAMHGFEAAGGVIEDDPTPHAEFLMSCAVNDEDDIAELVFDHWSNLPQDVTVHLNTPMEA